MNTFPDILNTIHGGNVLDMATGGGGFLRILQENLASWDEMIGIDAETPAEGPPSDPFCLPGISFREMDAHNMTFPDNTFDTVTIFNGLHHMAAPGSVLAEGYRVLKPGGRLIAGEMTADGQNDQQLTQILIHDWRGEINTELGISHNPTFSRQDVEDLFSRVAFSSTTICDYPRNGSNGTIDRHNEMVQRIDEHIEKARDLDDFSRYCKEGRILQDRVRTIGFDSADAVVIIGTK